MKYFILSILAGALIPIMFNYIFRLIYKIIGGDLYEKRSTNTNN